jgi:hypothetical protein
VRRDAAARRAVTGASPLWLEDDDAVRVRALTRPQDDAPGGMRLPARRALAFGEIRHEFLLGIARGASIRVRLRMLRPSSLRPLPGVAGFAAGDAAQNDLTSAVGEMIEAVPVRHRNHFRD